MKTIELTSGQGSVFDVDIKGKRYTLAFAFNGRNLVWTIDLSLGGVLLLPGVPAVIGVELFQGHAVPDVPRNIFMMPVSDTTKDPDFNELGITVKLVEIEEEDNLDVPAI